jgi:molybdopterin/thiamine biosynthesis adenylyltransferase
VKSGQFISITAIKRLVFLIIPGQIALKNTSFLIVGAGGLGCSASIHLSGSGAGMFDQANQLISTRVI